MANEILIFEFESNDRNPNTNGSKRVFSAEIGSVVVRMIVKGVQGSGLNTGLVVLSDVTVPRPMWDSHKEVILAPMKKSA
jgi:hypothetical protein